MVELKVIKEIDQLINKKLRDQFSYDETYHIELHLKNPFWAASKKEQDAKRTGTLTLSSEIEGYSNLESLYLPSNTEEELHAKTEMINILEDEIKKILRKYLNIKDEIAVDYDMGSITFIFDY